MEKPDRSLFLAVSMRKPVPLARPYVSVVHFLKCKTWMLAHAVHKGVPKQRQMEDDLWQRAGENATWNIILIETWRERDILELSRSDVITSNNWGAFDWHQPK